MFVRNEKLPDVNFYGSVLPAFGVVAGFLAYGFILGYTKNSREEKKTDKKAKAN